MLGQVSEGSLYPIQSSTDTPYLNNNTGYSSYGDGVHVNSPRNRLNTLGLSQLMRNYAEGGHVESPEFEEEFDYINELVETSFDQAVNEPKIDSRSELIYTNSQPLVSTQPPDGKIWNSYEKGHYKYSYFIFIY
jgi:hypothetical protein